MGGYVLECIVRGNRFEKVWKGLGMVIFCCPERPSPLSLSSREGCASSSGMGGEGGRTLLWWIPARDGCSGRQARRPFAQLPLRMRTAVMQEGGEVLRRAPRCVSTSRDPVTGTPPVSRQFVPRGVLVLAGIADGRRDSGLVADHSGGYILNSASVTAGRRCTPVRGGPFRAGLLGLSVSHWGVE